MSDAERGQVSGSAAEVYEAFFVPALFGQWTGRVADAARVEGGQRVLDVACGTGTLARELSRRIGPRGQVVGLDVNPGMLAVAEHLAPEVDWRQGEAERLPFEDESFDAVMSQFGLMFFQDRPQAVAEMIRVLRPGGRLAVAVWDSLDHTPGYAAVVALLQRLFGEQAADALRAPFVLGDREALGALFDHPGLSQARIATLPGMARFASIRDWMHTDVKGWTLAELLDERQYGLLVREAEQALDAFVTDEGSVAFPAPAHVVTAVKG